MILSLTIDRDKLILSATFQAMTVVDLSSIVFVDLLPTDGFYTADFTNTDIANELRALKSGEPRIPLPFDKSFDPELVRDWLQERMPQHMVALGQCACQCTGTAQGIDYLP